MKVKELIEALVALPPELKECEVAYRGDGDDYESGEPTITVRPSWLVTADKDGYASKGRLAIAVYIDEWDEFTHSVRVKPNQTIEDIVRELTATEARLQEESPAGGDEAERLRDIETLALIKGLSPCGD